MYTPGPWKVGFSDGSGAFQYEEEGAAITAEGNQVIVAGGQDQGVPVGVRKIADAKLIAQAPALLEALEAIVAAWDITGWDSPLSNQARAAIEATKGDA